MLYWTIRTTIISVVVILILHNLLSFFTNMLTVPKIKDLVDAPSHKYDHIFKTINATNINDSDTNNSKYSNKREAVSSMKNELKSFMKSQLKGGPLKRAEAVTEISALDSLSSSQFSEYR